MFKVSDSEKKVLTFWAIIGVIILFLVVLVSTLTDNKFDDNQNVPITATDSNKIIDRSRYYTVKNAILKYYSYINMKDYEAVITILDSKYKRDNDINSSNISSFLETNDVSLAYQSKVMCLKDVKDGVYTYVVEGEEISANKGNYLRDKFYEISLDGKSSRFSLKPIDESNYKEVCNG